MNKELYPNKFKYFKDIMPVTADGTVGNVNPKIPPYVPPIKMGGNDTNEDEEPGTSKFVYSQQSNLDSLKDNILNYKDFQFDVNEDALYQQYARQYAQQGKLAMEDAIGQASAMTGGYGNSYATTVGNQAYQSYLQQVNDVVPEVYQMALDRYNADKSDLYNKYALLSAERDQEYGEYTDALNYGLSNREMNMAEEAWNIEKDAINSSMDVSTDDTPIISGKITDAIYAEIMEKAGGFVSNEDLAAYLDGMVDAGSITEDEANAIYAYYEDENEKYLVNEDGTTGQISYKNMVENLQGWTKDNVVSDGGGNLWGIDKNAKVTTPDGKTVKLSTLKKMLMEEGMGDAEATEAIKRLQNHLGISNNWFFGL